MSETQTAWVLARLQRGPLTAIDALREGGCFRLASRVLELRADGHVITTELRTLESGKRVAVYHLTQGVK